MKTNFNRCILFFLLFCLGGIKITFAQCGTIMVGPNQQQYPDVQTNLPPAKPGLAYQAVIQLYVPQVIINNGTQINLSSIHIDTVLGLPLGFLYVTHPLNGNISATSSGCIIIQSNSPIQLGTFPITINLSANTNFGILPYTITGYKIVCNTINGTQLSSNFTYFNFSLNKVGSTLNNEQTTGTTYRRVQVMPSNKIGVAWNTSPQSNNYNDIGTGYNLFDGNAWIKGDTAITRIESQSAYAPSYSFKNSSNEEIILSTIYNPSGYIGGFVMSKKSLNSNTWTQSIVLDTLSNITGLTSGHIASSGNYLHVIACYSDSNQNQPNRVVKNGVKNPIVYSRFNFNSNTWDIKTVSLPNYNSSFYNNGEFDSYSIDATGNNVAILVGSIGVGLSLWKSTNNGSSWTKTIVDTFYQAPFREKSTIIDPAISTADAHLHVLVDNSGKSHCFWTRINIRNADTTDGVYYYYPENSHQQLLYWKEGLPLSNKKVISEFSGNPINGTPWQQYSPNGSYYTSFYISNPSAGISADGKIYCIYTSPTVGDLPIGIRDVYLTYSKDSGNTWSSSKNLTGILGGGLEQGFPSIAKTVNQKIHFSYSQSTSVGPYTAGSWDIIYHAIDTSKLDSSYQLYHTPNASYTISDSVFCKGQTMLYSITDASLYINGNLISKGRVDSSYTPQSSGSIVIKSIDGQQVIKTITLTVIDSLNLSPRYNGNILSGDQVLICGLNKSFQFGVTTGYQGAKTIIWKFNDTLTLTSRLNLLDTFSQAGKYSITIKTPSGCQVTKQVSITKYNNNFNPDFTANRQIITSPPFDVFFTNTTPSINDYKFYWSWGDGSRDTTEANLLIPKTYNNNGLYSIGLIAQNKTTGCRDSILKVSYISCTGQSPQPLSATLTKTSPLCFGTSTGTITINPSGGTAPYTYRINGGSYQSNNTFVGLSAGIYTLELKDALNTIWSKVDTLLNPLPLIVGGITGSNGVPVGSTRTYSVTQQPGVVYSWNIINGTLLGGNGTNNISVLWSAINGTGKVIVTLTKGICSSSDTIIVSIGSTPLVLNVTKINETCIGKEDGSLTINAQGGMPPYMYSINNSSYQQGNVFNNLSAGLYLIKVKDSNSVIISRTDTILSGTKPIAGVITGLKNVATLSLQNYIVGQQTNVSYLWSVSGGVLAGGQNTNIAQVSWGAQPDSGFVRVILTNNSGCSDTSMLKINIGSVGLKDLSESNNAVSIFPNPTKEFLNIKFGNVKPQIGSIIRIHDILGRLIYDETIEDNSFDERIISVSKLSAGNYILTIATNDKINHIKFIKQ